MPSTTKTYERTHATPFHRKATRTPTPSRSRTMHAVPPGLPADQSRETLLPSGPVTSAPTSNSRYSPLAKRRRPAPTDGCNTRLMGDTPAVIFATASLPGANRGGAFPKRCYHTQRQPKIKWASAAGMVLPYRHGPKLTNGRVLNAGAVLPCSVSVRRERVGAPGTVLPYLHCPEVAGGRCRDGTTSPQVSGAGRRALPGRFSPYHHCPR